MIIERLRRTVTIESGSESECESDSQTRCQSDDDSENENNGRSMCLNDVKGKASIFVVEWGDGMMYKCSFGICFFGFEM